ncbi:MAG: hypothetical protein C0433_06100 [Cyclobacterium sp.]|nr:hypothetical protein [Cyclobacterium sp.]
MKRFKEKCEKNIEKLEAGILRLPSAAGKLLSTGVGRVVRCALSRLGSGKAGNFCIIGLPCRQAGVSPLAPSASVN